MLPPSWLKLAGETWPENQAGKARHHHKKMQPLVWKTAEVAPSMRERRFYIAQASSTARYARSNRSAAQRSHHARSRAMSMSMPETLCARSFAGTEGFEQSRRERREGRCGSHT